MLRPGEQSEIIRKIRMVAKDQSVFEVVECLRAYHGNHFSWEWRECLNLMVTRGELYSPSDGKYSLKEMAMTPQKFWMVWVDSTPTTEHRHPSYQLASEEADRVARQAKNMGKKVYVLEAVECRWVEKAPLTYKTL